MGGWGEPVILVLQLLVVATLAMHDRRVLGSIHPVTLALFMIVTIAHLTITALSKFAPFAAFAGKLASG
jgi:hypothetical protein